MLPDEPGTERLAEQALARSPEAFAALVQRVQDRLTTWIALRLGPGLRSRVEAEDVLQETLLQVHRSLDQFEDRGPGSFRRWLFSVAGHRVLDLSRHHRAARRDERLERRQPRTAAEAAFLEQLSSGSGSPASIAHAREARLQLVAGLEALDDDLRHVVTARALEECTYQEIAERLGRPVTTVQAQYARGLRELRSLLGEISGL